MWLKPLYGTKTVKGRVVGVSDAIVDVAVPRRLMPIGFKPAQAPPYASIVGDCTIVKEEE